MTRALDDAYAAWKGWDNPAAYKTGETYIWSRLHNLAGLKPGQKLLEIGFGQGSHLHYCKSKGIDGTGLERNEKGIEIARKAGLNVFLGTLNDLPASHRRFDVIAAFDVIEHVPIDQLLPMMQGVRQLLNPGGRVLLSFPNGASPFGRLHQHGDLTHVNAFTRESLEQLCVATGFTIRHFGDFPEYFEMRTLGQMLKSPARRAVRALVRVAVKSYFDEPLGLSVAAVLE